MRAISEALVEQTLAPLDQYAHQCHAAALELVRSGVLGRSRVARGSCAGVGGQHSWAVVGGDCYDDAAVIVDATAWSYGMDVPRVWVTTMSESPHRPHGYGNLLDIGIPYPDGGEHIELAVDLSPRGRLFVQMVYRTLGGHVRLDRRWWARLANGPMGGWPSSEIIAAMKDTPELTALVPIDIVGMVTDRNPGGLYLPGGDVLESELPGPVRHR